MKEFQIIYSDPPWQYNDRQGNRPGTYPRMTLDELEALPVGKISAKDAFCFMWATWPKIDEAIILMSAWGFKYKTCAFIWVKIYSRSNPDQHTFLPVDFYHEDSSVGMGHYTRANSEPCLIGVRGHPLVVSHSVKQIVLSTSSKHSRKPIEVHRRIVRLCGDVPRLEMFARGQAPGWTSHGNEIEGGFQL